MLASPRPPTGEDRGGRIMARRARHAAARVRPRPAQIETPERHSIIRGTNHRTGAEQLVDPHLAVEDVATDQPEPALEVERRMDLPSKHGLGEAGSMTVDGCDDLVGRFLALLVPAAAGAQIIAEMLAEQARHVSALRRQGLVERRGN